jgi:hypothetical protein
MTITTIITMPARVVLDLAQPDPALIDVRTIAHALARLPRYIGHTTRAYTVAEHSLALASWCRDHGHDLATQRHALLHDAHEAYVGDVSRRALAAAGIEAEWQLLCDRIQWAIHARYGLAPTPSQSRIVHDLDRAIVAHEIRVLVHGEPPADDTPYRLRKMSTTHAPDPADIEAEYLAALAVVGVA